MIYITGDLHAHNDISKLNMKNFPAQKELNKNDYVIVCGDFGCVWDGGASDKYWQDWLNKKNFTTLFADGNHENFDLLNGYTVSTWNGGKVHFINDSVIHLMRGQVFNIDGKKLFTMGGATSIDKVYRTEGVSWWPQEIPSHAEFEEALDNLDKNNWAVDYVISHTASMKLMEWMNYIKENNPLNSFFNMLEENLTYKHWYFGHFHDDINIDDKHTLLYNKIVECKI